MGSGKPFDFGAAFNFGVERLKANPGMTLGFGGALLGASLCFGLVIGIVLFVVASALAMMKLPPGLLLLAVYPLELILIVVMQGTVVGGLVPGFFSCLEKESKGEKTSFADLYKDQSKFVNAFIATALSMVAIFVGSLLCFVPGILVSPIALISLYRVWKGDSGLEAFKKSFPILFSNFVACLCVIVCMIVSSVGVVLCFVGLIASVPVGYAAAWHLCKQICEDGDSVSQA